MTLIKLQEKLNERETEKRFFYLYAFVYVNVFGFRSQI